MASSSLTYATPFRGADVDTARTCNIFSSFESTSFVVETTDNGRVSSFFPRFFLFLSFFCFFTFSFLFVRIRLQRFCYFFLLILCFSFFRLSFSLILSLSPLLPFNGRALFTRCDFNDSRISGGVDVSWRMQKQIDAKTGRYRIMLIMYFFVPMHF